MFACASAHARDEAALRACLARNLPQKSLEEDVVITRTGNGGERRLVGSWYWQRDEARQRGLLRLSAPADLAGAAYLFLEHGRKQDFYVWLPAVKKVRHVTGATAAQSLFDSGLSAFDLKFLFSGLRDGNLTNQGKTSVVGRPAELWRYQPPADPDILYDRVDLSVDDAWCLPLQADLFGGVPWKKLSLNAATVRQVGGRWTASRATLTDLRDNSSTLVEITTQRFDLELPASLFRPGQFYKGK